MKIYIETLGCVKNEEDSERVAGILEHAGHSLAQTPESSDLILVNTCGFIGDAKKESIERIFDMTEFNKILMVSGCLSERYKNQLYKEMPEVDIFLGVNDYADLPNIIKDYVDKNKKANGIREKHFSEAEDYFCEKNYRKRLGSKFTASLKIAEGCDNKCAYCVIPGIRGGYRSRKKESIIEEAEKLVNDGCKELVLIAQDVTAYGIDLYGKFALAELVKELCKIEELKWLRLMYCYEDRITDDLIKVMAEEEKVCKYIDIPIQHSEDNILKTMNRRSTRSSILSTIKKLRNTMPDIHIRTTLITGFPGETNEDFLALADFVEDMKFERLGVFAYSKEEGTEAGEMKGQIRQQTKEKRRDSLMNSQMEISLKVNQSKVGKALEVLIEELDSEENGYTYIGRSRYDAPEIDNSVIFTSKKPLSIGDIVEVRIIDAFDYDLVGII